MKANVILLLDCSFFPIFMSHYVCQEFKETRFALGAFTILSGYCIKVTHARINKLNCQVDMKMTLLKPVFYSFLNCQTQTKRGKRLKQKHFGQ
jgi:hypothetical protein